MKESKRYLVLITTDCNDYPVYESEDYKSAIEHANSIISVPSYITQLIHNEEYIVNELHEAIVFLIVDNYVSNIIYRRDLTALNLVSEPENLPDLVLSEERHD